MLRPLRGRETGCSAGRLQLSPASPSDDRGEEDASDPVSSPVVLPVGLPVGLPAELPDSLGQLCVRVKTRWLGLLGTWRAKDALSRDAEPRSVSAGRCCDLGRTEFSAAAVAVGRGGRAGSDELPAPRAGAPKKSSSSKLCSPRRRCGGPRPLPAEMAAAKLMPRRPAHAPSAAPGRGFAGRPPAPGNVLRGTWFCTHGTPPSRS